MAASIAVSVKHRSGIRPSVSLSVCPALADMKLNNHSPDGSTEPDQRMFLPFSPSTDTLGAILSLVHWNYVFIRKRT